MTVLIVKNRKSHNIEGSLIKPSLIRAAELVLGTVQTSFPRFHYQTIYIQGKDRRLVSRYKTSNSRPREKFSCFCRPVRLKRSQRSRLLVYARFMLGYYVKEEIQFCHSIDSCTAAAIFRDVLNLFQIN